MLPEHFLAVSFECPWVGGKLRRVCWWFVGLLLLCFCLLVRLLLFFVTDLVRMDKKTFGVVFCSCLKERIGTVVWKVYGTKELETCHLLSLSLCVCVDRLGCEKSECPLPPQHSFYSCPFFFIWPAVPDRFGYFLLSTLFFVLESRRTHAAAWDVRAWWLKVGQEQEKKWSRKSAWSHWSKTWTDCLPW